MNHKVFKIASVALALAAPLAHANTNLIQNGDFSNSNVAFNSYLYGNGFTATVVSATPWSFADGAGIANHSSAWDGVASTGTVAFIQSYSGFSSNSPSISQAFISNSSDFSVSFDLAKRATYGGIESLTVTVDNVVVVANLAPTSGTFASYSFNVSGLTGGSHLLKFQGLNPTAGDSSVFIDNVNVVAVPEPASYAMFWAGLGLIGAVASRRKQ